MATPDLSGLGLGGMPTAATPPDLSGLGMPAAPEMQPMPMAPVQPAPAPDIDTTGAVADGDRVWVRKGEKLYTVPRGNLVQAAEAVPGLEFASPEEVRQLKDTRRVEQEFGGAWRSALDQFSVGFVDAITAPARGTAALASVAAGALGATKAEAALQEFVRDSGGEALARDSGYLLHGGVEGENEVVRGYQARERAFPIASGIGRAAGLVVPALATAGGAALAAGGARAGVGALAAEGAAEAGGASALSRLASTIFTPLGVKQAATAGAASGLVQGAAAPFETMDDTPISREAILASGGMGALLGGALGGGTAAAAKYAPGLLSKVFGKTVTAEERAAAQAEIRESLPDAIKQLADSASPDERSLYQAIVDRGQRAGARAQEMAARIEAAAKEAGPNPEFQKLAAQKAVAHELDRLTGEAGAISKAEWRSKAISPDDMVFHRETLKQGAREEITGHLGSMIDESKGVMEHLRNFELKESLVRKNLEKLTQEQATAALSNSLDHVRTLRGEFEQLFVGGADALRPSRSSESIGFSLNNAEEAIRNAPDAAAGYRAIDQMRREIDKRLPSLMSQTRSTLADEAYEGTALFKFADQAYERTRQLLADEGTWGAQGRLQAKVNQAWADDIAAEGRVTKLGAFLSRDIQDRYGRQSYRVDPDKIERYLDGLGQKTLPDSDLKALLSSKVKLMKEVAAAYELPPEQVKKAITAATELRDSLDAANRVMTESGGLAAQVANLLSTRASKLAGHAAGGVAGGVMGGIPGALVGHSVGAAIEEFAAHKIPALISAVTRKNLDLGIGTVPQVYQRALTRNALAGVPAESHFLFEATRGLSHEKRVEAYEKRAELLARLNTNAPAFTAASQAALGRFDNVQPTMATSTALAAREKLQAALLAWPKPKAPPVTKSKASQAPSEQDLQRAESLWLATTRPLSIFEDFANGDVDAQQVAFTWQQHPELQRMFQGFAIEALGRVPEDEEIPSNAIAQLDFFLGFNGALDESLDRSFSRRMDALGAEREQQRPPPSGGQSLNLPTAQPTHNEQLAQN